MHPYVLSSDQIGHYHRADSRFVPSQWETALLCNGVSHWRGANLESALLSQNQNFWLDIPFIITKHFKSIDSVHKGPKLQRDQNYEGTQTAKGPQRPSFTSHCLSGFLITFWSQDHFANHILWNLIFQYLAIYCYESLSYWLLQFLEVIN